MKQQNEIVTVSQALNPAMGFNMTMNRYVGKDGSECVMHNNKTHVTTADGKEWTLASSIVTASNAGIPSSTVTAPKPAASPAATTTQPVKK